MYLLQPVFSAQAIVGGILSVVAPVSGEAFEQASRPAHIEWRTGAVPVGAKSKAEIREAIAALRARGTGRHFVVAFDAPLMPAERAALQEAGLRLLGYLGSNAFFASLLPGAVDLEAVLQVASLSDVRSIERGWKLHPMLASGRIPRWAVVSHVGDDEPDQTAVVGAYIMFHRDVALVPEGIPIVTRHGAIVRSEIGSINALVIELPFANIPDLADEDAVLWIEPPLPRMSPMNDSNRVITQAEQVQAPPYGLDGTGVTVLVYDTSHADTAHPDFGDRLHARDDTGGWFHPTHVACTIGGDGASSSGLYRGMAPNVTLESYGFEHDGSGYYLYTNPGDMATDYEEAVNVYGATIANNSIGLGVCWLGFPCQFTGDYGTVAYLIDAIVRGSLGQPFRIVWANGNERNCTNCPNEHHNGYHSTPPPACAKNSIAVGALNSNDDSMTDFSSWGPCDDGRIKPDIAAPGCQVGDDDGVTSCTAGGGYTTECGTSMAAPTVTGLAALLIQDYRARYPGSDDLLNSTLKALLAHNAADLGNPGPDYQAGYGSVRVKDTIDFMRQGNFFEASLDQGQTLRLLLETSAGEPELKVTVAWDDPPVPPNTIPALVNDIDLVIQDPLGTRHFPWTLDPANPSAPAIRTRADHTNNVEQVLVESPASGTWRLDIEAFNTPEGPQTFSVCASGSLSPDCNANGVPDESDVTGGTSADCNGNGIPDECDIDCNDNAVPDDCDIAVGTSADCDANTIPDECEDFRDCDSSGVHDPCEIRDGLLDDCNGNWVADQCEPDCNTNGMPDECEVPPIGPAEADCNANGVPDECDPDCNLNGTPDACDISSGTSADCDGNGIPDECIPQAPSRPGAPHNALKNRYISISFGPDSCARLAFQVELGSLTRCSGDLSRTCRVDGDCPNVCENDSAIQCVDASACGGGACVPTMPCVEHPHVGSNLGWVGEPFSVAQGCSPLPCGDADWIARIEPDPVYRVWTENVLHIGDCRIVPVATYGIRATGDGILFSDALVVDTIRKPDTRHYGDVAGAVDAGTGEYAQADGFVNIIDVQAYKHTVQNYPNGSPYVHRTWVDLHGLDPGTAPNYILSVSDLQRILFGFEGRTYAQTPDQLDPGDCP